MNASHTLAGTARTWPSRSAVPAVFRPNDSEVLGCAYHAGYANVKIGKTAQALPQLRFYVQNADPTADRDEAGKILETRFVIAQLLAAEGYPTRRWLNISRSNHD